MHDSDEHELIMHQDDYMAPVILLNMTKCHLEDKEASEEEIALLKPLVKDFTEAYGIPLIRDSPEEGSTGKLI